MFSPPKPFFYFAGTHRRRWLRWTNNILTISDIISNYIICFDLLYFVSLTWCFDSFFFFSMRRKRIFDNFSYRDGNGTGQGQRMRSLSSPCMVLSCPISAPPYMTGKIFLPHPRYLGSCETLPYPIKLYFLLICPHNYYNFFFNKTCFINKNIFEITTKFILSNQINF